MSCTSVSREEITKVRHRTRLASEGNNFSESLARTYWSVHDQKESPVSEGSSTTHPSLYSAVRQKIIVIQVPDSIPPKHPPPVSGLMSPKHRKLKSIWIWSNGSSNKGSKLLFAIIKTKEEIIVELREVSLRVFNTCVSPREMWCRFCGATRKIETLKTWH